VSELVEHLGFHIAERLLTLLGEDLVDRPTFTTLDVGVQVDGGKTALTGQTARRGGFARDHEAHEEHVARQLVRRARMGLDLGVVDDGDDLVGGGDRQRVGYRVAFRGDGIALDFLLFHDGPPGCFNEIPCSNVACRL